MASGRYVHVVMYSTTPEEVICLLSDMTEMYETHEALDRSEKLLRNIYDNIPVGIELYDRNGLLVDLNNKDLEIFGIRDKEDVLGVDFSRIPFSTRRSGAGRGTGRSSRSRRIIPSIV